MERKEFASKSYSQLKRELEIIKKRASLELKVWQEYDKEYNNENYERITATKKHGE